MGTANGPKTDASPCSQSRPINPPVWLGQKGFFFFIIKNQYIMTILLYFYKACVGFEPASYGYSKRLNQLDKQAKVHQDNHTC